MTKFRMSQKLVQVVIQNYWEEFDTTDQDAWEDLLSRLNSDGKDISDYPDQAPDDSAIWFDAYKQIYYAEYENQDDDDWYSDRKGSTEYEFILTDDGGDVVMSE